MKLDLNCIVCNINQTIKMADSFEMSRDRKEALMKEVLNYLSHADYTKCNPEIMAGTWDIIITYIENDNPYYEIKKYYNNEILQMTDTIEDIIDNSRDSFSTALKIAIAGNLIDFGANHKFSLDILKEKIMNIEDIHLSIDHSNLLYERLKKANSIMYLGDNCGEICLDKLFIKHIKKEFPHIKVYFGVRGKAIINDVTLDDATMVGMQDVAEVISNGDKSLGTVMEHVSNDFKNKFYNADVVIAKGQGNYESLNEIDRKNIFYLFMAKCTLVSKSLGIKNMSIVCAENSNSVSL